MSFFDDLGKKLTQAGQTAAAKTKELADLAKMNSQIADENRKIENAYLQIGKEYVAAYAENPDPAFEGYLNCIKEANEKIQVLQKQIKEIKGVVKCENCGAEVANGSAFCSSCGAPMPVVEPAVEQPATEFSPENTAETSTENNTNAF